jgi:uncharacterized protein (TIGR03067 family)
MRAHWFLALALVLGAATDAGAVADRGDKKKKADPVVEEWKKLRGTWNLVAMTSDGQRYTADQIRGCVMTIEATGKWSFRGFGNALQGGTFKVNPTKRPKTADFVITTGPYKGKTCPEIYQLNGDTLKFCYPHPARIGARPSKFASTQGSWHIIAVYQRGKPK